MSGSTTPSPVLGPDGDAARPTGWKSRRTEGIGSSPQGRDHVTGVRQNDRVIMVALLALALVMLHAVADILPDAPLFWIVTPLRLVIVVGLVALLFAHRSDRQVRWRMPFDVCALVLVVAAAIPAHLYGGWPQWRGFVTAVAVGYLALGLIRRAPDAWPALGLVSMASVATAALAGLRQTINDIPTGFCRGALDGSADACGNDGVFYRALGTFGNPNLLAGFLLLITPLAFAYAASLPPKQRAVGYLIASSGIL
ncbi:MAG: hypothetical protein Q4G43_10555, partial [Mobilicoccus sp.]|nr:hypothetical protein [Mobilicoccus sp.]